MKPANSKTVVVGQASAHDSAAMHVQGNATYIDDMLEPDGLLHVVPGYSKEAAKGKIISVDLMEVKNFPGVVRVLTHLDIPAVNDCSPALGDDPILAETEIAFHGQVVFAVVAETRDAARRAARLAKINIAAEAPAVTVTDAIAQQTKDILPPYAFKRGDVAKVLSTSAHHLRDEFDIGGQEHFYLEGQVSLAIPGEQGGMTVHCSTQHPTEVQHIIAKMLGVMRK
jgi:xanthine dehydrogenase large subunit